MELGKIVYSLEDLQKVCEGVNNKIGIWSIGNHGEIHIGHRKCYEFVKRNSDFIIGLIANTWMLQIAQISNNPISPIVLPISKSAIKEVQDLCDVVMIYDGDYTSFDDPRALLGWAEESLPRSLLPPFISENEVVMDSLRAAQIFKKVLNSKVRYYYHCGSLKDPWRFYYANWHNKLWPDRFYELIDPAVDEYGQSISDGYPDSLRRKINKPLLLKGMRSIDDIKCYIQDIEGLEVLYFAYDPNTSYILARFHHDDFPNKWWNVGLKDG